jgi:hypothetical protein
VTIPQGAPSGAETGHLPHQQTRFRQLTLPNPVFARPIFGLLFLKQIAQTLRINQAGSA